MQRRHGSWPALLVLAVAFLLLFYWQRSRSDFLRIDSQRFVAETMARDLKVPVADILALRDMIGLDASAAAWRLVAADFGACLSAPILGGQGPPKEGPEVVPVASERLAEAIRAVAPDALAGRRFLLVRERFAARH